jgi:hypothetical protein
MSIKGIDTQLASAYLFMEELSKWLGRVDSRTGKSIIDELTSCSGTFSSRSEYVVESIPEILANVRSCFQDEEVWERWEDIFNGRNYGLNFLRCNVIDDILLGSCAYINSSLSSRRKLIKNLRWVAHLIDAKKSIRRTAEVALGRPLGGISDDITCEDYYSCFFDAIGDLTRVEVTHEVLFSTIAAIIYNAPDSEKNVISRVV